MKCTKKVLFSIVMLSLTIAGFTSCNNDDREENMSSLNKSVLISSNRDAIVIETPEGEIKIIYTDNNKDDKKENNQ